MELMLEDEDDSTIVTIIGSQANILFGIPCEELVHEKGEDGKYNVLSALQRVKNQYHVWRIGYGIKNDFLVKEVYLQDKVEQENDDGLLNCGTVPQPATPSKRVLQPQKEETINEYLAKDNRKLKRDGKRGASNLKGQSSMSKINED